MSTDIATTDKQGGGSMVDVATGRVIQEVQAAMTIAKRFPRDVTAATERIRQACKRNKLAENAFYSYSKGNKKVFGPSIRLAEILATGWGNVDFGITELEQREGESDLQAFCWDLETNTRQTKTFTVKHEIHLSEKKGGGIKHLTDPRDIYELGANYGARRMRNCILAIIPQDVQDMAVEECQKTLKGKNDEPLIDRIRKMVGAFSDEAVSKEMLERRLQHSVDACNETDLVTLRGILRSMKDGMSKREDWFEVEVAEAVEGHKEQAKAARKKAKQKPAADSQVDPDVEATEGVDEETDEDSPDPVMVKAALLKKIKAVKVKAVCDAVAIEVEDNIQWLATPDDVDDVKTALTKKRQSMIGT